MLRGRNVVLLGVMVAKTGCLDLLMRRKGLSAIPLAVPDVLGLFALPQEIKYIQILP